MKFLARNSLFEASDSVRRIELRINHVRRPRRLIDGSDDPDFGPASDPLHAVP